jgi:LysR family transcriptional regulator (chromosome initiation inhibitor)
MSLLSSNLQAFLIVYEKSSVSGAAAELGIGQTAVTQRIRSLENEIGVSLFTRSRKGMKLTTEGKSLLNYCLRANELEGQTFSQLKNTGSGQEVELRIAGPTSFISGRAVPNCKEVLERWPHLNLQFTIDDRENRLELLKQGLVDIVVLYPHQVPPELDSKLVKPDEYLLLGHPSWKGRELKDILQNERIFAFHGNDHTSLNYLKSFNLIGFLKRPRLFVNENLALSNLMRYGVGFGLLSKEIAEPIIKKGELIVLNEAKTLKDPLALAWYPRSNMPTYFKEIVRSLK